MITQVCPGHRRQPALTLPATTLCLRDVRRPATVHVARGEEASADVVPMSFFAKNIRGPRDALLARMHTFSAEAQVLHSGRSVDGQWTLQWTLKNWGF